MAVATRVCAVVGICVGVLTLLGACDHAPSVRPDPLPSGTGDVARLEVTGPRTIAPGQSATFKAMATLTDGSSRDVTSQAAWQSDDLQVFRITAPGQGTAGVNRGDAAISAVFNRVSGTLQTVVLPPGTYRLSGVVRQSHYPMEVVADARVEVLDAGERLETFSDVDGRFVLFGVPSPARIRITRGGYVTVEQLVQLTDHQSRDFPIALDAPTPDLGGTYTLRITMPTPCGRTDPGTTFRDRTYTATVMHKGPTSVVVNLTGADMVVAAGRGNWFTGTVYPGGATFNISGDYYYYYYLPPQLVERIDGETFFVITGTALTTITPQGLVGTLQGSLAFYRALPGPSFASCLANNVRFAFSK